MVTEKQRLHAINIADEAGSRIIAKYKKGQEENKDNLWDRSKADLLEAAIDETVDQIVYLLTLRNKFVQEDMMMNEFIDGNTISLDEEFTGENPMEYVAPEPDEDDYIDPQWDGNPYDDEFPEGIDWEGNDDRRNPFYGWDEDDYMYDEDDEGYDPWGV